MGKHVLSFTLEVSVCVLFLEGKQGEREGGNVRVGGGGGPWSLESDWTFVSTCGDSVAMRIPQADEGKGPVADPAGGEMSLGGKAPASPTPV